MNVCPISNRQCDRPDRCGPASHDYCNRKDTREVLIEPLYGFHWTNGWFFKRLEDGSVRIRKHVGSHETVPVMEAIVPAAEWASIVCSVSAFGETGERWNAAQDFHGRPDHGTVAVASGHPLERLWQAIVDNTTDESFWIAEILLHEIEKETGFNGNGSPSVASAEGNTP